MQLQRLGAAQDRGRRNSSSNISKGACNWWCTGALCAAHHEATDQAQEILFGLLSGPNSLQTEDQKLHVAITHILAGQGHLSCQA